MAKSAKSAYTHLYSSPDIPERIVISHFDLKWFICDDLATSHKKLVRFCLVTSEFKRVVGVQPLIFQKINHLRQIASGSAKQISNNFSPNGRYLILDYGTDLLIPIARLKVPCYGNHFKVKMGKIGQLTFIRRLGIPKRGGISQFRFGQFIYVEPYSLDI